MNYSILISTISFFLYFFHPIYGQSSITAQEIDSNIYIFSKNNNLQFALSSKDFEDTYPVYSYNYQNQLSKYLEKNPYDLDSLLRLYEIQGYIYNLEGQKNTLIRYKNTIDKKLSQNSKDMLGLLHASEYNRIKKDKFLQMNLLDTALKYYPEEFKVKEFYLDYCIENQNYEQAKLFSQQILNHKSTHLKSLYNLVILNFYENAYYGIRDDYSLIDKYIQKNPDYKPLRILKTYLETINFILNLTDYEFGEMNFKSWRLPMVLKNSSDSLYQQWLSHLPYLSNQAVGYSLLSLIKFIEKDTLQARKHFEKAIQCDMYYKLAYYNYIQFQFEMENYKECVKSASILAKNIPDENHYLMLAKAYFFAKNYYQTEEILQKLLEKKTNEPHVFTALAQYYLKFRKMNEVEKYLNLAKQIDPRDADYNFTAAMYHIVLGNKKQAKEHLLSYLEIHEKDAKAWEWLKLLSL